MNRAVLKVLDAGLGASFQDAGRHGWRRFGVPTSGAMDAHAAGMANRLLNNPPWAAVVEILLQGAAFEALEETWVALAGADLLCNQPRWRALRLAKGDFIHFSGPKNGLWAYLAVEGGFAAPHWLDSASTLAPAGLGRPLQKGDVLCRSGLEPRFALPRGIAGRMAPAREQRDYTSPPPLRVWPGPQWEWFTPGARAAFFAQPWQVAAQSNRVGYRLAGEALDAPTRSMVSEPVLIGSIQVPPGGQPLVIMRDGPTVGGYPKIGLIDPDDVDWLAQCHFHQPVTFTPAGPA